MNIEEEIRQINQQLASICQILQQYPNKVGLASNIDPVKKSFSKATTRQDIKNILIQKWNKEHPFFTIIP